MRNFLMKNSPEIDNFMQNQNITIFINFVESIVQKLLHLKLFYPYLIRKKLKF